MIGPGFSSSKAGKAGLYLLALATASGGLFMQRSFRAAEKVGIESCDSFLEKKDVALGRAGKQRALLIFPPPQNHHTVEPPEKLPSRGERPPGVLQGLASWYGGADGLHGALTASGEPFDETALTAAHRTLPFGTRVRVTFLKTGKSVTVRINDRGPFVAGRIIDLSRAAAAEIGMQSFGVGAVTLEILP